MPGTQIADQVVRRREYERTHPETVITEPRRGNALWTAEAPGRETLFRVSLGSLLNSLESR